MDLFKISKVADPRSDELIELLARAYRTNPIQIAAFGGSGEKELLLNREHFRACTEIALLGNWYAVLDGSRIVGAFHMVRFPRCRLSSDQQEAIGARLAESLGEAAPRVMEWMDEWAKRDPDTDHWHLGPIAALPEYQKRGIGRLMMEHFCARVDETGAHAYLETDRLENLSFYEKSEFMVTDEAIVLGIPNWFMTRVARPVP